MRKLPEVAVERHHSVKDKQLAGDAINEHLCFYFGFDSHTLKVLHLQTVKKFLKTLTVTHLAEFISFVISSWTVL